MQVQDVMTKTVKVIDSTATLLEAAEMMRDEEIGALPVANAGRPIGMLTDRDIVVRALASYKDPSQTRVRDIITPRLTTIYADQDISEAAALMAHQQIRRLLVLDHDQAPVGILSLGDISLSEAGQLESAATASSQALKGVSEPKRDDPTERRSKP
jgi:CBS domain-containing protein